MLKKQKEEHSSDCSWKKLKERKRRTSTVGNEIQEAEMLRKKKLAEKKERRCSRKGTYVRSFKQKQKQIGHG